MPSIPHESAANLLLSALPGKYRRQMLATCEPVELLLSDVLTKPGDPIRHVYFPTGSVISLVMPIEGGNSLEVGLVGNEGMVGITLILEVDIAPFQAIVQGAGPALRVEAQHFLRELKQSPPLQRGLRRYLFVTMSQLAQTAACTRFHVVEARLARWLLMTQDRAHADTFHITHLFLSYMLGVRRVGITKAAHSLQRQKLISYHRGEITILNRIGLEAASCRCYQSEKDFYERMIGRAQPETLTGDFGNLDNDLHDRR